MPVRNGTLALGEFQRIVLMEFEGPRRRDIEVRLLAAPVMAASRAVSPPAQISVKPA